MTPWEEIKRLFHGALEQPAEGRAAWLAEQSPDGPEIRAEVERLLEAHHAAGSFIETPLTDLHAAKPPRQGARVGTWLGPYRLEALLGAGGMGEVYQAIHADLARAVAIKVVGRDESAAHDRLRREARNASRLDHPHICTIHHVGDHDGRPYIVMALVDGRPLSELIPPGGLPPAAAMGYGIQILDALVHAHGQRVIHRDLKSANVMVGPNGHVTLLDFGLARQLDGAVAGPPALSATAVDLTAAGGTLPYMAPEILRGQVADTRTDLWSFGVLLYEMLTGQLPFAGETAYEVGSAILNESPRRLPPHVPSLLAACIVRCLRKEPADRPQHAAELKAHLEAFVGVDTGVRAPGAGPRTRVTRGWRARASWRPASRAGPLILAVPVLLTALGIAGWHWRTLADTPDAPIHALAVLPIENVSGDASQDYFADGFTESLISALGKTGGLRVTSRTTAMHYRDVRTSLADVARELGVGGLVQGSVARQGDRVRVSARLLGAGQQELWTQTYERPAREILALQRDIVQSVAEHISLALTPQDDVRLSRVRAVDPDVYESYLKGRYHWNKRTQASLVTAVEHFRAAVAEDPTYAPAHVGLADCYNQMGTVMVAGGSPAEMRPRAIAAAIAALQIDPTLGEAHGALAYGRHYEWQWDAAGRSFERAIALDPHNPLIHIWYANYLVSLQRLDEAVAHVETARALDPLSPVVMTNVGWTLSYAGRHQEAIDAYREALAVSPNYPQAHMRLAGGYAELGDFDAARAETETLMGLTGRRPYSLVGLANINAMAGRHREAESVLREILTLARTEYVSPFAMAQPYLRMGHYDRAFEWLERAYEERSNGMVYLAVEPVLAPVRSDPRYHDLLRRVGLAR
jgi:eukaryotic-like serine/threonine-protein kinase